MADPVKEAVARAALEAAGAAIGDELEASHMVELVQADPLVRMWRVSPRDPSQPYAAPRYFVVQVKEAI